MARFGDAWDSFMSRILDRFEAYIQVEIAPAAFQAGIPAFQEDLAFTGRSFLEVFSSTFIKSS
jgi:hypothetical protein